jgi:hypothetical protein
MCEQLGNAGWERVGRGMERYRGVRVEGSKRVREIMNGTQHVYLLNFLFIYVS